MSKKILFLLIIGLLLANSLSVFATPYNISDDKDINKFQSSDYLDLTKAGLGESLRTGAKNTDFVMAVVALGLILSAVGALLIYSKKN